MEIVVSKTLCLICYLYKTILSTWHFALMYMAHIFFGGILKNYRKRKIAFMHVIKKYPISFYHLPSAFSSHAAKTFQCSLNLKIMELLVDFEIANASGLSNLIVILLMMMICAKVFQRDELSWDAIPMRCDDAALRIWHVKLSITLSPWRHELVLVFVCMFDCTARAYINVARVRSSMYILGLFFELYKLYPCIWLWLLEKSLV